MATIRSTGYRTRGGLSVFRASEPVEYGGAADAVQAAPDSRRGALFSSGFEIPGRYTRWDIGFANPPLAMEARGRALTLTALNDRGGVLLGSLEPMLRDCVCIPRERDRSRSRGIHS